MKSANAVRKISDKHHEAVRMMVLGFSNPEIASAVGLLPQQIANIRNSPIVRDKLKLLHERRDERTVNVANELEIDMKENLKVLSAIRDGNLTDHDGNPIFVDTKLRADTAFGLMDRAGYGPVKKIQGEMMHGHLMAQEIEEIKRRAFAAKVFAVEAEAVVLQT